MSVSAAPAPIRAEEVFVPTLASDAPSYAAWEAAATALPLMADPIDFAVLVAAYQRTGLDPAGAELLPRWLPADDGPPALALVIGRPAYRRLALQQYDCLALVGPRFQDPDGRWHPHPLAPGYLHAVRCEVQRRDAPEASVQLAWGPRQTALATAHPTSLWATAPALALAQVVEFTLLRQLYPALFAGLTVEALVPEALAYDPRLEADAVAGGCGAAPWSGGR